MNPQTFWINNKKHIQCVVLEYIHTQEDSWFTPSCHIPRFFIPRDRVFELTHSIEISTSTYNPPNSFVIITLDYIFFLLVSHLERPLAFRIVVTIYQGNLRVESTRSICRRMLCLCRRSKIKIVLLGLTIFGLFELDENQPFVMSN